MTNKWVRLFQELYKKIKPISGSINHQISSRNRKNHPIVDLWVNLITEGYSYEDPNLGPISNNGNFHIEIDLRRGEKESFINTSILDLENKEFELPYDELIGIHSNNILFSIPKCRFGKIQSNFIDFEMDYILDTEMGLLTHESNLSIKEIEQGKLKTNLKLEDLRVVRYKNENLDSILNNINSRLYSIDKFYKYKEVGNYEIYKVPLK